MSWELSAHGESGRKSAEDLSPGVVFDLLSSERRRILLSVLRDHTSMTERDLAAEVAARESQGKVDSNAVDRIRTTLVHAHLPKLERAGLVRRGPDERIALTADSPVRTPRFQMLLRTAGSWDADVDVLSDRRRREILSVLSESQGQFDLEELAERIAASERADTADPDAMRVSLHHVHLPKLDSAGIIEYDPERRTIVYEGLPVPYETWLEDGSIDDLPRREGAGA